MYFDTPLSMPRGTHYGSNYWEVYSVKMQRKACFFSNLEYENFLTLEMDPDVEFMCEQPLQIEIMVDGKLGKSVLDFWVKYRDGHEEIQEVKYSESLLSDSKDGIRAREQIRKQKAWCEENNILHTVRTELEIHTGEFTIENLSYIASRIRRYLPPNDNESYEKLLVGYLGACKKTDIKTIIESGMLPVGDELSFLCYMHYTGQIDLMIDGRPLDYRTEVSLHGK